MSEEPEIVETEPVPEAELEKYDEPSRDLRGAQSEDELQRVIQEHIVNDFENALNLIAQYQRALGMLMAPDPVFEEARKLQTKYRMEPVEPVIEAVFVAEIGSISTYTDSIPGTAVEVRDEELPAEATPGPAPPDQRPDLVRTGEVLPAEPGEEESTDLLNKRNAAKLAADGYEECPVCEGTGVATKGVLKGKKCSRCSGLGMWRPPETASLVADAEGNMHFVPTGGQPDE